MRVNGAHIAQLALPAKMKRRLLFNAAITEDIIASVLAEAQAGPQEVRTFANLFRGRTVRETLSKIWHYLRDNIRYLEDPTGVQFIKTPSRIIADRFGDCKSYTILGSSILTALGIPHTIRFTNYRPGIFRHVYLTASGIPMDACMPRPGVEKKYHRNKDFDMTQIVRLSGIGSASMLEGDLEYMLLQEQAALEDSILGNQVSGIGRLFPGSPQNVIGTGNMSRIAQKNQAGIKVAPNATTEKQEQLVADLLNGELEAMAPAFTYLFLKDPEVIADMSEEGQKRRANAVEMARFITQATGMDENIFMKIVRNGIMKQARMTPEQLLSAEMGIQVAGIGAFPALLGALIPKAVKTAKRILPQVGKIFKKKAPTPVTPPANFAPAKEMPKQRGPIGTFFNKVKSKIAPKVRQAFAPQGTAPQPGAPAQQAPMMQLESGSTPVRQGSGPGPQAPFDGGGEKSKTGLYIGISAGVLAVGTGLYFATRPKKRRRR